MPEEMYLEFQTLRFQRNFLHLGLKLHIPLLGILEKVYVRVSLARDSENTVFRYNLDKRSLTVHIVRHGIFSRVVIFR